MANVKKWKRPGRASIWRHDYLDAGGIRRRKTFKTKEAAEDFAARTVLEGRQHLTPTVDPDITVAAYAEHWLSAHPAKQGTIETYRKHLDLYLLPRVGTKPLRDLRRPLIKAVLTERKAALEARGCEAKATIRLTLAAIRKMLASAVSDEVVTANPAAGLARELGLRKAPRRRPDEEEVPAGEERDSKAFTRAERDIFLRTAQEEDRWCWRMWTVQVLTGLRPGELYALTEADLLLDQAPPKGPQVRVSKTSTRCGRTSLGGSRRSSAAAGATCRHHFSSPRTAATFCRATCGSGCTQCLRRRAFHTGRHTRSGTPTRPSPSARGTMCTT